MLDYPCAALLQVAVELTMIYPNPETIMVSDACCIIVGEQVVQRYMSVLTSITL